MKIRVEINGYGNDIMSGRVSNLFFNIFEDEGLEFDEYAFDCDYDQEVDIPENIRPFDPGCYFEADEVVQERGPNVGLSNILIYQDEEIIYNCELEKLTTSSMPLNGITIETVDPIYTEDFLKPGDAYFVVIRAEKGRFLSYEFETNQFELKKLTIQSTDVEGTNLISAVYYDGEELEDLGETNTDEKGAEAYLGIVEDE